MLLWTSLALAGGADFARGFADGTTQAKVTPCGEWAAYGACATCVLGPIGCAGVPIAGYVLEPGDMPPLRSGAWVPSPEVAGDVPVPEGVEDAAAYEAGFEEGFGKEVQRRRALMGAAGGTAVVVGGAGAYLGALAFVVALQVL